MSRQFAAAFASGDPGDLAERIGAALPEIAGANLGIIYASEAAAPVLSALIAALSRARGIGSWVGGVGLGVLGGTAEVMDEPAVAVMIAALPPNGFRVFAATADPAADLPRRHGEWLAAKPPLLALVHADPRCRGLAQTTAALAAASGAYLVGGLVSHRWPSPLIAHSAGAPIAAGAGSGGIAGVMLAPEIAVATALTQGCSPLGPIHRIDEARDNIVMAIDGRPALAVFCENIGPALAQDLRRVGGLIFAGLPIAGSDTGDYLVRNLMAIDPGRGWLVLGEEVAPGDQILFCRRDPETARRDLERMIRQLKGRLGGAPKAALYVSCVARGVNLFGAEGVETGVIRAALGEVPLIGFFANGEVSRDRLYGHTGVLTVFT
ncbi:MAG TPA: FIST C-terminal domain-containing protein [Stellaceae bacterium]|nr:FIST C-terminal domain-containing protein [Stellaceae bacterium]